MEHTSDELLDAAWPLWKKWSIPVGRILGIEVRIHGSVLLGILLLYKDLSNLENILMIFLGLFVTILVHELGHALTSKYFNNEVKGIIAFPPFGGIAFINTCTEKPLKKILIYLSGPAVNIVLALILLPLYEFRI